MHFRFHWNFLKLFDPIIPNYVRNFIYSFAHIHNYVFGMTLYTNYEEYEMDSCA